MTPAVPDLPAVPGSSAHHVPAVLRYTPEHEWVCWPGVLAHARGGGVRVGLTSYAQAQLGDIVWVTLPAVGRWVQAGAAVGEVESTTSLSDLFAPVSGVVVAHNDVLAGSPELVNADPYGEGWLLEMSPDEPAEVDTLLDADAYRGCIA